MPHIRPHLRLLPLFWAAGLLAQGTADSFRFPLDVPWQTTQSFDHWNVDWYGFHLGEDVVVSSEMPVFAAGNGTVIHVGQHSGYGWVVVIQHSLHAGDPLGPSVATLYAHLRQNGITTTGPVEKGAVIGYLSSNPNENGGYNFTHIHFGVKKLPLEIGCPGDDPTSNWWVYAGYSSLFTVCNTESSKIKIMPTDPQFLTYAPLHAAVVARWTAPSDFINARQATPSTVIFSDYGPGRTSCSFFVCSSWGVGEHLPEQPYYRGMPFTAGSSTFILDSISVTAYRSNGPTSGQFIVSVNADSGGFPGAVLEQFTFSNLPDISNTSYLSNPYPFTATSVLHPALVAGTQYWLTATVNDPSTVSVEWVLNNQGVTGLVASHIGNTAWIFPFGNIPQPLATFSVTGKPK